MEELIAAMMIGLKGYKVEMIDHRSFWIITEDGQYYYCRLERGA